MNGREGQAWITKEELHTLKIALEAGIIKGREASMVTDIEGKVRALEEKAHNGKVAPEGDVEEGSKAA